MYGALLLEIYLFWWLSGLFLWIVTSENMSDRPFVGVTKPNSAEINSVEFLCQTVYHNLRQLPPELFSVDVWEKNNFPLHVIIIIIIIITDDIIRDMKLHLNLM